MKSTDGLADAPQTLRAVLIREHLLVPGEQTLLKFGRYLSLLMHWNSRFNLTAIRDPEEIVTRHFVESVACAQCLPGSVRTVLDFGSGAGFPGIPIALCRPEIAVTLAESQNKKSAFLREAVRSLDLNCSVISGRGESIRHEFDAVVLRAVDRMDNAIAYAGQLVRSGGFLLPMTSKAEMRSLVLSAGPEFSWGEPFQIPSSDQRIVAVGTKR